MKNVQLNKIYKGFRITKKTTQKTQRRTNATVFCFPSFLKTKFMDPTTTVVYKKNFFTNKSYLLCSQVQYADNFFLSFYSFFGTTSI